jgi:hypothetical protein
MQMREQIKEKEVHIEDAANAHEIAAADTGFVAGRGARRHGSHKRKGLKLLGIR